jgi:hypothetical protein
MALQEGVVAVEAPAANAINRTIARGEHSGIL